MTKNEVMTHLTEKFGASKHRYVEWDRGSGYPLVESLTWNSEPNVSIVLTYNSQYAIDHSEWKIEYIISGVDNVLAIVATR